MQTNDSCEFTDLIYNLTGKWANWDPGYMLEVGDFGKIDRNTGELKVKGNIYKDSFVYDPDDNMITELLEDNPPTQAPRTGHIIATNAKMKRLNPKDHVSVPGIAEASLKGQWSFGTKGGALLIMNNPTSSSIKSARLFEHLENVVYLQGMYLITEVFCTSAFSFFLSHKNREVVKLALLGSVPHSSAPTPSDGARADMKWWSSTSSGLLRSAAQGARGDCYVPLYTLKEITGRKPQKKHWYTALLPKR